MTKLEETRLGGGGVTNLSCGFSMTEQTSNLVRVRGRCECQRMESRVRTLKASSGSQLSYEGKSPQTILPGAPKPSLEREDVTRRRVPIQLNQVSTNKSTCRAVAQVPPFTVVS